MSIPEASGKCPICDSPQHSLYPIMVGKYSGKYVCSTCHWKLWENRNNPVFEIQRYKWNKKMQDYVPLN